MGTLTTDLAHVRWIAGGTGAGKSTVARILAHRFGLSIYDGVGSRATICGMPNCAGRRATPACR